MESIFDSNGHALTPKGVEIEKQIKAEMTTYLTNLFQDHAVKRHELVELVKGSLDLIKCQLSAKEMFEGKLK